MTLIDLLKIFKMEKFYEEKKHYLIEDKQIFTYHFGDNMNCCGTSLFYSFEPNELIIFVESEDFSQNSECKTLHLLFNTEKEHVELVKNLRKNFTNELFPLLSFDKPLVADLEFVAGIINNILIPKHNLHWSFHLD